MRTSGGEVPAVAWDWLQGSGTQVVPDAAPVLHQAWEDHLASLGIEVTFSPEEVTQSDSYREGAVTRVEVNRYERNRRARDACIAHHGTRCVVCGFDFAAVYGGLGDGFIHVHHLKQLADLPEGYLVDPIKDLVPVCANCHAMSIGKGRR